MPAQVKEGTEAKETPENSEVRVDGVILGRGLENSRPGLMSVKGGRAWFRAEGAGLRLKISVTRVRYGDLKIQFRHW